MQCTVYVSTVKYEKRQLYLILPMCFAPSICRRNNSSRRHGTEQYNYGNMKVNERIADVKLPRNLWAFLSELFIKRCALELKVSRNQSNAIMCPRMNANTVEWLWRALERHYLIIKIRRNEVKAEVYKNEKSICTECFSEMETGLCDDTWRPLPTPWWKFMAFVMKCRRSQVWVKLHPECLRISAGKMQRGRSNNDCCQSHEIWTKNAF